MSRSVPRARLASLLLVPALTLGACGDSGAGEPSEGSSAATTTSSTSPSEPSPTVEPADGPWMKVPGAKLRTPKGWVMVTDYLGLVMTRRDKDLRASVALSPAFVSGTPTLDQLARQMKRRENYVPKGSKRLEDVVVGGTLYAYHFRNTSDRQEITDSYGIVNHGGEWTITFDFPRQVINDAEPMDAQERQELIDSVLATFENIYPD